MALLSGGSEVYAPEEPAKNIPQPGVAVITSPRLQDLAERAERTQPVKASTLPGRQPRRTMIKFCCWFVHRGPAPANSGREVLVVPT